MSKETIEKIEQIFNDYMDFAPMIYAQIVEPLEKEINRLKKEIAELKAENERLKEKLYNYRIWELPYEE